MARQTVLDVFGRIYPNATPEMTDYKFRLAQMAGQLSGLMEVGVELSFRTTLLQYLEKK
ncbi:hypothetical protein I310_04642 [Cryptococcus deuterogattii CA1014]|nr:hypothetical protein I310_04642 [Cryptococcus deuterogattii CA1014]